jgi:hypothetical protein
LSLRKANALVHDDNALTRPRTTMGGLLVRIVLEMKDARQGHDEEEIQP